MQFIYETERLLLKIVNASAAEQILDFYLRDKELFEQFEPDRIPDFYTIPKLRQISDLEYRAAQNGTIYRYYAYEKENPDKIIGTVCFHDIRWGFSPHCEIGYKFSSAYHRRGYATEALQTITQAIFTDLGLHYITAWVLPDNIASISLLTRVGFAFEKTKRSHLFLQGQWRDHAMYVMLNPKDRPPFLFQSRRHSQ
ncbi:MAG: GNAT family N-acetyltransferase [Agathobacter sp.]|nr:GNAT family N-acetyltransferase [Agathobacter sp.]